MNILTQTSNQGITASPEIFLVALLAGFLLVYFYNRKNGNGTFGNGLSDLFGKKTFRQPERKASFDHKAFNKSNRSVSGVSEEAEKKAEQEKAAKAANGEDKNVNPQNDLRIFVSRALNYTRKHRMFCIFPGYVTVNGEKSGTTMLIVTKEKVIGILAYGFFGKVTAASGNSKWTYKNGRGSGAFENPYPIADESERILKEAMREIGYPNVPVQTVVLFTTKGTNLVGTHKGKVFDQDQLFAWLDTFAGKESSVIIPKEVGTKLNALIPKQKAQKGRRK